MQGERERERGIWMATTKAIEWVSEIEKAENFIHELISIMLDTVKGDEALWTILW